MYDIYRIMLNCLTLCHNDHSLTQQSRLSYQLHPYVPLLRSVLRLAIGCPVSFTFPTHPSP